MEQFFLKMQEKVAVEVELIRTCFFYGSRIEDLRLYVKLTQAHDVFVGKRLKEIVKAWMTERPH